MKSVLLDRGNAVIKVYPETEVVNTRGERVRIAATKPVAVRVSISPDRNASAELPGQVDVRILRCVTRSAPVGSWSRITYDGEEWDLTAPPHFSAGLSKATRNVTFTLRSRNTAAVRK